MHVYINIYRREPEDKTPFQIVHDHQSSWIFKIKHTIWKNQSISIKKHSRIYLKCKF